MFFIFNLLVLLFRPSLTRMVLFFYVWIYGSSHRRCSVEKGVYKNFANFTGKHLFWSLFYHFEWQIKTNDLKFISTDILVSFLRLFSLWKMCMLYLQWNGFNVKIKTLKHCQNLLKVSNEIKQYVKKYDC